MARKALKHCRTVKMRITGLRIVGNQSPRSSRKRAKIGNLIAFVHTQTVLLNRFVGNDPSLNNDDLRRLYAMVVVSNRRRQHDRCGLLGNIERADLILFQNRLRSEPAGFTKSAIERFRSLAERYLTGDMKLLESIDALSVKT